MLLHSGRITPTKPIIEERAIETIPKRGYRFVAPVEEVSAKEAGGFELPSQRQINLCSAESAQGISSRLNFRNWLAQCAIQFLSSRPLDRGEDRDGFCFVSFNR